jgi:hypothetical protein
VKRELTISAAGSNTEFRDLVRDCWLTLQKADFRLNVDRYGAAVGDVASGMARNLRFIGEMARASTTPAEFLDRFEGSGSASQAHRAIKRDVVTLVEATKGFPCTAEEIHRFFAHLVLIEFDFLHGGATSETATLSTLKSCIDDRHQDQVPSAWSEVRRRVREGAGKSEVFDRPKLVRLLAPAIRLAAAVSLKPYLAKVTDLTRQWLADIEDDVGGTHIDRAELSALLTRARSSFRVVQITGLPGSGKSVLLRRSIEAELTTGPVLLLKSGRLDGTSWSSFAQNNGLSGVSLSNLLVEIGATGSSTLFIDGIDRIEKHNRLIVVDLIRAILTDPLLDNWRVVMSLRDTGMEPLRNWLGSTLASTPVKTIDVRALDDAEATALAEAKPHLQPLLFGPRQVQEIVRRPFFAKILEQNFSSRSGDASFRPQSEADLISNWWRRGGYDAEGQGAFDRQRAIVELGRLRARHMEREISVRDLGPSTAGLVDQFVGDGILQHVGHGHALRFAHDIFFEWSFFHVLQDAGAKWLDEIIACGEPPAVARVVELHSQSMFGNPAGWVRTLSEVDQSQARSQWTRAWLLAPLGAPNFNVFAHSYAAAVEAEDFSFLKKALVWFQAERTTPNTSILQNDKYSPDERIRIADLLGWPLDFAAWRRFIKYLLSRSATIPVRLRPEMLAIFEVWQNAAAGVTNKLSSEMLYLIAQWLTEIEKEQQAKTPPLTPSPWDALGGNLGDFRSTLARLLFCSASVRPDLVRSYLDYVIAADDIRGKAFQEVASFSPFLASGHADQLVELTLKYMREDLPDDRQAKEQRKLALAAERRKRALAKAPEDRTESERRAFEHAMSPFHMNEFGRHDWNELSIDCDTSDYFPASPLREPFHSLFAKAPDEALRLVRELSNHAITAWRQLHDLSREKRGTPIPLELTFPWGIQRFWGGEREYQWSRGLWAPEPLQSAYLALENWALKQLADGRPVDELIQRIIRGNECIAVLGVASLLLTESETISEVGFTLLTSQRLLMADEARRQQDFGGSQHALIGFKPKVDALHALAVQEINTRPARGKQLSNCISRYFLTAGEEMSERIKAAILRFQVEPPFSIEEQRDDLHWLEHFRQDALAHAEFVTVENYRIAKVTEDQTQAAIVHVSPSTTAPEHLAKVAESNRWLRQTGLWIWAKNFFDKGELGSNYTVTSAIGIAKDLQAHPIKRDPAKPDDLSPTGALAAAAAMALHHREGLSLTDLKWARNTLREAVAEPEERDMFWSYLSVIPWHPDIFAARAIEADIRHGTAEQDAAATLLCLVAHPLECVSREAIGAALRLWDVDSRLSWTALHLGLSLCEVPPREPVSRRDQIHDARTLKKSVKAALKLYKSGTKWPALPIPPAPWVEVQPKNNEGRSFDGDDYIDEQDLVDPKTHWKPSQTWWNYEHAAEIIERIPVAAILQSEARELLSTYLKGQLDWTIAKICPPWIKHGRRDRGSTGLSKWMRPFGGGLGRAIGCFSIDEMEQLFIRPIFDLPDEQCWDILAPIVSAYLAHYVYDAATVPTEAPAFLLSCLERVLTAPELQENSYRAGKLSGFDLPALAEALMFVAVEYAGGATRFVNGDWSEIFVILPVVDRFVRAAGWSVSIMSKFLTLCERARAHYPGELFADQVLDVIAKPDRDLLSWHGTFLSARIAGLVQDIADRETPMPMALGQKLLRILDVLVDMGDRRSAALQQSEAFREVQTVRPDGCSHRADSKPYTERK